MLVDSPGKELSSPNMVDVQSFNDYDVNNQSKNFHYPASYGKCYGQDIMATNDSITENGIDLKQSSKAHKSVSKS